MPLDGTLLCYLAHVEQPTACTSFLFSDDDVPSSRGASEYRCLRSELIRNREAVQPRMVPEFFSTKEKSWKSSLAEEGYVVLTDVLAADAVSEALQLLLRDLQMLGTFQEGVIEKKTCFSIPCIGYIGSSVVHDRIGECRNVHHGLGRESQSIPDTSLHEPLQATGFAGLSFAAIPYTTSFANPKPETRIPKPC